MSALTPLASGLFRCLWLTASFLALLTTLRTPPTRAQDTLSSRGSNFIEDAQTAIHDNFADDPQMQRDVQVYKEETETALTNALNHLAQILDESNSPQGDLEGRLHTTFTEIDSLFEQLNQTIYLLPEFDRLKEILTPMTDSLTRMILRELPPLRSLPKDANPAGTIVSFYNDTAQDNPLGLGSLFSIPPLATVDRDRHVREQRHYFRNNESFGSEILFREEIEYDNGILANYRLTINDRVVQNIVKAENLSILHGVPQQMRQDGMDSRAVRLMEEYIRFINYHLIRTHEEEGLLLNRQHPQLQIPKNYQPRDLIANVIHILTTDPSEL